MALFKGHAVKLNGSTVHAKCGARRRLDPPPSEEAPRSLVTQRKRTAKTMGPVPDELPLSPYIVIIGLMARVRPILVIL